MPGDYGERLLLLMRQLKAAGKTKAEIVKALTSAGISPDVGITVYDAVEVLLKLEAKHAAHGKRES